MPIWKTIRFSINKNGTEPAELQQTVNTHTHIELYQMEWLADKVLICCTKSKS